MEDLTEDQQVERLKAWWAENGTSIIAGVVLGGAGLFGWNYWQASELAAAQAASIQFDKAAEAASASDLTLLTQAVNSLRDDHAESPYVVQGQLQLAALHVQRGETEEAQTVLTDVYARSKGMPEHAMIGLRLARVQLYRDDPDSALATLETINDANYASLVNEIRGDVLRAQGLLVEARDAYTQALNEPGDPPVIDATMLRMKRAALPVAEVDETS
ncbi:MAG: tetratricopeptide repeat protein [Pseudomonadota bacterium]